MEKADKIIYLECTCSSKDHMITIDKFEIPGTSTHKPEVNLYIQTQMVKTFGFWRRIWASIKYIFMTNSCKYGHWDESIINFNSALKLKELLDEYFIRIEEIKGE